MFVPEWGNWTLSYKRRQEATGGRPCSSTVTALLLVAVQCHPISALTVLPFLLDLNDGKLSAASDVRSSSGDACVIVGGGRPPPAGAGANNFLSSDNQVVACAGRPE